jgi:hypothetical protein
MVARRGPCHDCDMYLTIFVEDSAESVTGNLLENSEGGRSRALGERGFGGCYLAREMGLEARVPSTERASLFGLSPAHGTLHR